MSSVGYAEIQIEACSGEQQCLAFQRDTWRESRIDANQAVSPIFAIALGGKEMKDYQDKHPWSSFFPEWAHITRVTVMKRNPTSGKAKPYVERTYVCDHTKE